MDAESGAHAGRRSESDETPARDAGSRVAKLGIVEVFAGLGCVSQGFAATDTFAPHLLVDVDEAARDSYTASFPRGGQYRIRNVAGLSAEKFLDLVGGADVGGFVGCPPCQGLSSAGARDRRDPRNRLLGHYFRLLKALRPPFFMMENVPKLLRHKAFWQQIRRLGDEYAVWQGVLNAACFGIPQTRQRAVVIGYRRDLGVVPTAPRATHFGSRPVFHYPDGRTRPPSRDRLDELLGTYAELRHRSDPEDVLPDELGALEDLVTVEDAISDLPPLGDNRRLTRPPSAYATRLRPNGSAPSDHKGWGHGDDLVARLRSVPEGKGLLDERGAGKERPYFSQAYARLHRRGLARTITTNFHNPGSGRFTHYAEHRALSIREAARLQGLPDSLELAGDRTTKERLVGNAFPLLWAEALARHIEEELHDVGA